MSYSFRFTAATKEEASARAAQELASVIALQPNHEKDCAAALRNIDGALALLVDDPEQDIRVDAHGSLSWLSDPEQVIGVSIGAIAWYVPKGSE